MQKNIKRYLFEFASEGHTDEKRNLVKFLTLHLPIPAHRDVFVEIGNGNGVIAKTIAPLFKKTIIIEPDKQSLRNLSMPDNCTIVAKKWENVFFLEKANLVLCSHTIYYFQRVAVMRLIRKMYGTLKRGGSLVIIVNAPNTKLMNLLCECFQYISSPLIHWVNTSFLREAIHGEFPSVRCFRIESSVFSSTKKELIDILYFLAGSGRKLKDKKMRQRVARATSSCRKIRGRYVYPICSDAYIIKKI